MYASTKKPLSWGTLLLIIVLIIGVIVGGYFLYSYWKAHQDASLEISLAPTTTSLAPTPPTLPGDLPRPVDQLTAATNIQETLQNENDALLVKIQSLEINDEQLGRLKVGQEVLSDFAHRFFKYETVLNNASFFQFFSSLVLDYIENRAISVKNMKESNPLFRRVHEEFVAWVLAQEDEKLIALAHFVGFYLVEHLYQLPLTLLASGLSSEIEVIDFQVPVIVSDIETSPIRDGNGELKMNQKASLKGYTSAQQFLYRRGPQFSSKVLVFLYAYLAYEGY